MVPTSVDETRRIAIKSKPLLIADGTVIELEAVPGVFLFNKVILLLVYYSIMISVLIP